MLYTTYWSVICNCSCTLRASYHKPYLQVCTHKVSIFWSPLVIAVNMQKNKILSLLAIQMKNLASFLCICMLLLHQELFSTLHFKVYHVYHYYFSSVFIQFKLISVTSVKILFLLSWIKENQTWMETCTYTYRIQYLSFEDYFIIFKCFKIRIIQNSISNNFQHYQHLWLEYNIKRHTESHTYISEWRFHPHIKKFFH